MINFVYKLLVNCPLETEEIMKKAIVKYPRNVKRYIKFYTDSKTDWLFINFKTYYCRLLEL